MKKLTTLAAVVAMAASSAVFAEAPKSDFEFSANVSMATDYRFRGWSQTDTSPAIQGGFDMSHSSGFYAGVWGSNVDFAKSMELDYYVGFATDVSEDVAIDVGYLYYDYPGTPDVDDYQEIYGSVSFSDITLGLNYSDDYYFETGKFFYLYADYSISLPEDFSLSFHLGHNDFDRSSSNADAGENVFLGNNADSYLDYSIGISKEFSGIELGLTWIDTDLSDGECAGSSSNCEGAVVFSISKSL